MEEELLKRLAEKNHLHELYDDPFIRPKMGKKIHRIKENFELIQQKKEMEGNFYERIISYLTAHGKPQEYAFEDLGDKYLLLDWIACQLSFQRPIKTKPLFLYGQPSTQKSLLIHILSKVLRIYFPSARRNDFAGADDFYDLWVFDKNWSTGTINVYESQRCNKELESST